MVGPSPDSRTLQSPSASTMSEPAEKLGAKKTVATEWLDKFDFGGQMIGILAIGNEMFRRDAQFALRECILPLKPGY